LVDEYNTKLSTVNNIMQFKQLDYNAAKDDYNTSFTQTLQLQQLLETEKTREANIANVQTDNARANLTVMMNLMKDSNLTIDKMSDDFKTTWAKEAMKAGISVDSLKAFLDAKPGVSVDYMTTSYDENGNEIAQFWSKENGGTLTKTIKAGGAKAPTTAAGTEETSITNQLSASRGTDGYVDPGVYLRLKTTSKMGPDEFDKRYSIFLSPQEKTNLGIKQEAEQTDWDLAESNIQTNIAAGNTTPSQIAELYAAIKKKTKMTDSDIKSLMSQYGITSYYGIWTYVAPSQTTPPATKTTTKKWWEFWR